MMINLPHSYGIELSGEVRPTLDDDERKYYVRTMEDQLARTMAHHIIEQKRGAFHCKLKDFITETRSLELVVMTPMEYLCEIRKEAKRYLELTQRYPLYPSSKPYKGGF